MGIASTTLQWLEDLYKAEVFNGLTSILDLGPQSVLASEPVLRAFGETTGFSPQPHDARAIYEALGLSEYKSLDLGDASATYRLNLNEPQILPQKFDVITNFGTLEHIFNIGEAARTIHNNLSVGGVQLHCSPTRGDYNHGFFNIHSIWFSDLAIANGYTVLSIVNTPDHKNQHNALFAEGAPRAIFDDVASGVDSVGRQCSFAQDTLARPHVFDYIHAALKKVSDAPFVWPQQALWR
jgi:hypothetical protein